VVSPAYWASPGWKKSATRLLANGADLSAGFFKELGVLAAHRRREALETLWAIACRYRHKACELSPAIARYLCKMRKTQLAAVASVAPRWREAFEMLWAIACRYRDKACEELWPAIARHLCITPKTQLAAVASVALVSGVVSFLATSSFLNRPVAVEALEAPPPPPKLSWITYYELQHAQKLGRSLLDISPADLLSMYERQGDAAVDSYRDGWVKLDYPITSFGRQTYNNANYDVVEAKAHFNSVFPGKIIAIFNSQKWHARLAMHRVGDQIVAFCQFKDVDREQVLTNIDRLSFYGIRCDLP
jgi:hypothetical protein